MAISKLILNGTTQMDVTDTTATASDVAQGKVFYAADGTQTIGTASGGGGASSWTKVCETSYQVTYTSNTAVSVATWSTGHSELWTSDKIVYLRVRDTAGKRAGYFYGTDNFFINQYPKNGATTSSSTTAAIYIHRCETNEQYTAYSFGTSNGYGVYLQTVYSDGRIIIGTRYSSTYSLTIDGTYSVEVYLLDPPTGAPIFE